MIPWLAVLKSYKSIAIGLAVLAITFYVGYLKISLSSAKSDLIMAESQVEMLKSELEFANQRNVEWQRSFNELNEVTDRCNQSVVLMQKKTDNAKKSAAEAIKKAEAISQVRIDQINAVSNRPANNSGTCEQSVINSKNDLRGKS